MGVKLKLSPHWPFVALDLLSASLFGLAILLAVAIAVVKVDAPGQHWGGMFRPAALTLAAGGNPYFATGGFFNPPWVLLPLVPLAFQPAVVGQVMLAVACAVGLYVGARRLGASRLASAAVMLLPSTVFMYGYVNLDWLAPIGLLLPPWLGLFFVLAKPQLGLGIAAYWLALAWRRGGPVGIVLTFGPLAAAGLLSVRLYGPWFLATNPARLTAAGWSLTFWPWTVPIGLLLIVVAIRRRFPGLALFGGALLSPYMAFYSWTAAALGLLGTRRGAVVVLGALAVIGLTFTR